MVRTVQLVTLRKAKTTANQRPDILDPIAQIDFPSTPFTAIPASVVPKMMLSSLQRNSVLGQDHPREVANSMFRPNGWPWALNGALAVSRQRQGRLRQDTIEAGIVPKVIPDGIQFQITVVQTKRQLHQFA